jgi:hypothetical protein
VRSPLAVAEEFIRDFEQLVAWLAVKMDKDALRRLVGIDWDTVGRICDRVVADELDPGRLNELFDLGVDEISWKKHHNYLRFGFHSARAALALVMLSAGPVTLTLPWENRT